MLFSRYSYFGDCVIAIALSAKSEDCPFFFFLFCFNYLSFIFFTWFALTIKTHKITKKEQIHSLEMNPQLWGDFLKNNFKDLLNLNLFLLRPANDGREK